MPILEMHLLEGRTVEQKRNAVAAITEAITSTLGVRADQVRILIAEHGSEDFAVAGVTSGAKRASQEAPGGAEE